MKKLLLLILVTISISVFSQESKFSVELSYPISSDSNFFGENYKGILDLGVKGRFIETSLLNIGISLNTGFYKDTFESAYNNSNVNVLAIQPKLFTELDLESIRKLHPSISLGYTLMRFAYSGPNIGGQPNSSGTETKNGLNVNFGMSYDFTERLFVQFQYDFVKLNKEDDMPDITYNTNVSLLKLGLGYKF